jgi:hypothetical protein
MKKKYKRCLADVNFGEASLIKQIVQKYVKNQQNDEIQSYVVQTQTVKVRNKYGKILEK